MRNFILTVLVLAVTCLTIDLGVANGKVNHSEDTREVIIDQLLQPYVFEFHGLLYDAGIELNYGSLVMIKFSSDMRPNLLGIAWGMGHSSTIININSRLFFSLTHQQRRLLIFHEMAHDLFNLYHGSIGLMDTPMPQFVTKDMVDKQLLELIKHIKDGR
jgi:hypothetical protein